jgi:hypothetical protein
VVVLENYVAFQSTGSAIFEGFPCDFIPFGESDSPERCVYFDKSEAGYVEFRHGEINLCPVGFVFYSVYVVKEKTFKFIIVVNAVTKRKVVFLERFLIENFFLVELFFVIRDYNGRRLWFRCRCCLKEIFPFLV